MSRIVLITGANGHLGRTVIAQLAAAGVPVRALVLPGEKTPVLDEMNIEIVRGDVRDSDSMRPLFAGCEEREVVLIHAAAIIDITSKASSKAYEVNVNGTKNVVRLAQEYGVYRFIHISSVHAIPPAPGRREMHETKEFSSTAVEGGYAKTKAEATRFVLDSVREGNLPAVILHPSGIVGPGDSGTNNAVAAIQSYFHGRLPACPRGGYDLVDVRDVALAVLSAIDHGRVGETYILSGKHYEFSDIFAMIRAITGQGKPCPIIPLWIARLAAPVMERLALRQKKKPIVTSYSMQTLSSNDNFTHEKASRELNFWPRDFYLTLEDTLATLEKPKRAGRRRPRRKKARANG